MGLLVIVLAYIGAAPLAMAQGLLTVWGLWLLSLGPAISTAYSERGRQLAASKYGLHTS